MPSKPDFHSLVAIAGPTGGGKAALAMEVAERSDAILISCDSMKVYRGMDVGTAKPDRAARERCDWRCLDLVWPWQDFDAHRFVVAAEEAMRDAREQARPVIVSGGTALYLKALTEGLFDGPGADPELRASLRAEAELGGSAALHERLVEQDPAAAAAIHPNDVRRIVRALEVGALSGAGISSLQVQFGHLRADRARRLFVVTRPRESMDERINLRVDAMFDGGWLDECRHLASSAMALSNGPLQAIGYREIFAWLDDPSTTSFAELAAGIKTKTRRFARRQLTWLKKFPDAILCEPRQGEARDNLVLEICQAVEKAKQETQAGGPSPAS